MAGHRRSAGNRARAAGEQSLVLIERLADNDAVPGNLERAKVFAVRAAPYLHHGDDPLQLTVQLDVALERGQVGQQRFDALRDAVMNLEASPDFRQITALLRPV